MHGRPLKLHAFSLDPFILVVLLLSLSCALGCDPDTSRDGGGGLDAAAPDDAASDAAASDAAASDAAAPDAATPDDAAVSDAARPDAGDTGAGVLFEENFDGMDDWTTESRDTVGPLPPGFDYGYTGETWHPTDTAGSLASMSITGRDPEQVFGGAGKALIVTYESAGSGYTSDGFLTRDIPPSDEVYVRFRMRFEPGFNAERANGSIKLFRILSYDGTGSRSRFFGGGNSAPIYIFNWSKSDYGVRHKHAFRCDDQATTYYCTNPSITGGPRSVVNGDMSANFSSDIADLAPGLPDLLNGGTIPSSGTVEHDQVYGDVWHTMELYVKLNSAPTVNDGILRVRIDGRDIIDMSEIPWIGANGSMDARWNSVSFGGNGRYLWNTRSGDPVSDRERWVAIDDILIRDSLPAALRP